MTSSPNSLERLVPDGLTAQDATGQATYQLHLERYEFAAVHAQPGRLLDIACGVGYGTRLMADRRTDITETVGVDISPQAIESALKKYGTERVRFSVSDAATFRSELVFDTVVSLETIEHVSDPYRLIDNLVRLLRPGGIFIGSVPTTLSTDANPHHLHDFSAASFRKLLARFPLREVRALTQVQPFNPIRVATRSESRLADMRPHLFSYYAKNPKMAAMRLWTTMTHGFNNKYLTLVMQRDA